MRVRTWLHCAISHWRMELTSLFGRCLGNDAMEVCGVARGNLQPQCLLHLCFAAPMQICMARTMASWGGGMWMAASWTKNRKSWNLILEAGFETQGKRAAAVKYTKKQLIFWQLLNRRKGAPICLGEDWINPLLGQVCCIYSTRSHIFPYLRKHGSLATMKRQQCYLPYLRH